MTAGEDELVATCTIAHFHHVEAELIPGVIVLAGNALTKRYQAFKLVDFNDYVTLVVTAYGTGYQLSDAPA